MMLFESGEQRYDIDVVVISFGLAMQHRSFALIEGLKEMEPSVGETAPKHQS